MAKTLLDSVNAVLKRAKIIAGETGELGSLQQAHIQNYIDTAVDVVNEGIEELYTATGRALPTHQKEDTVTLVQDQRDYDLASDLVRLRWPLIDKDAGEYIFQFPGGYNQILLLDPEQDDTGQPNFAAISPLDGKLYLDRIPTAEVAGAVYTYQYDRDLSLDDATDEVPFNNPVWRAMVPVWTEMWKREQRGEFDSAMARLHMSRAARLLTRNLPRDSWSPR